MKRLPRIALLLAVTLLSPRLARGENIFMEQAMAEPALQHPEVLVGADAHLRERQNEIAQRRMASLRPPNRPGSGRMAKMLGTPDKPLRKLSIEPSAPPLRVRRYRQKDLFNALEVLSERWKHLEKEIGRVRQAVSKLTSDQFSFLSMRWPVTRHLMETISWVGTPGHADYDLTAERVNLRALKRGINEALLYYPNIPEIPGTDILLWSRHGYGRITQGVARELERDLSYAREQVPAVYKFILDYTTVIQLKFGMANIGESDYRWPGLTFLNPRGTKTTVARLTTLAEEALHHLWFLDLSIERRLIADLKFKIPEEWNAYGDVHSPYIYMAELYAGMVILQWLLKWPPSDAQARSDVKVEYAHYLKRSSEIMWSMRQVKRRGVLTKNGSQVLDELDQFFKGLSGWSTVPNKFTDRAA